MGAGPAGRLPVRLTSFIGREAEIAEATDLLHRSRLVTLTGSGGCGKTRLALRVASEAGERYRDGVRWVDLAPLTDPGPVPSSVADALSIREVPGQPIVETITSALEEQEILVVLDNCEHVVEACAGLVDTILRSCPGVTVLATSRRTIGVEGEVAFRVPSLALPGEGASADAEPILQCEAIRLFVDRAEMARPGFSVHGEGARIVADISRRLDGLPLAIELAAARVGVLSLERIADELTDVLRVLTRGARTTVPRHQTLRASVEWSHGLLTDDERVLLRRLAVFAGGFTLDAAEAVGSGDGIPRERVLDLVSSLVDASLVEVEDRDERRRYRLLETIRQYAGSKLEEAEEDAAVRARHLDFYTELAERSHPQLQGAGMVAAIRVLREEQGNVRAALDWGAVSGRREQALRLAGSLATFWFVAGPWTEVRARFERLLAGEIPPGPVLARGLVGAAAVCFQLFDWPAASAFAEQGLAVAREADDRVAVGRALSYLGTATMWMGDIDEARPMWEEAVEVARGAGDLYTVSQAHWALGNGELVYRGRPAAARAAFEESLRAGRESGNPLRLGMALTLLGNVTGWVDLERSETLLREADHHLGTMGESAFRAAASAGRAWIRLLRGDLRGAREQAGEAVAAVTVTGHAGSLSFARFVSGWAHRASGDLDAAVGELEESARLGGAIGMAGWEALFQAALARARADRGELDEAEAALERARSILEDSGGVFQGLVADAAARVARERRDPEAAETMAHEALPILAEHEMLPWLIDLLELLGWAAAAQEHPSDAARLYGAAGGARERMGYVRPPVDEDRHEEGLALARSALGEERLEKALAEGAGVAMEDALAYARRGRGERKRPSHGWASLTPAELQVAGLVADRLTNPQIAERLFVSRSTVKAHLSHIYAKLGISSRMELADEYLSRRR